MRILLTLFVITAAACTQQKQKSKPVTITADTAAATMQPQQPAKTDSNVLEQYKNYLSSLDKQQPNNVKAALLNYEWLFAKKDTALCDSGYALFNEFYEETGRYVQNHISPEEIPAKRKKEMLQQMKQYGFRPEATEGTFIYTTDRDSINPKFYFFVSATMKKFMLQQHIETNNGRSGGEGSMAISPEVFAKRYVFWQQFYRQHPNFLLKHWAFAYSRTYAEDLVFGMENTPLMVDEKLTAAYETIYTMLLNKYGNENFVTCYKKYFEALKTNDAAFIEKFKEKFRNGDSEKTFPDAE